MNCDDPKLTAYALGELDATESAEVETFLATSEEGRAEVAAIRSFAGTLATSFKEEEPATTLSPAQREALARPSAPSPFRAKIIRLAIYTPLAAAMVVMAYYHGTEGEQPAGLQVASRSEPTPLLGVDGALQDIDASAVAYEAPTPPLLVGATGLPTAPQAAPAFTPVSTAKMEQSADSLLQEAKVKTAPAVEGVHPGGSGTGKGTTGQLSKRQLAALQNFTNGWSRPQQRDLRGAVAHSTWVDEGERRNRAPVSETAFREVAAHPLSTFSVDVDTASYTNVRRYLNEGSLPPPPAVRIEEMINYFTYDLAPPAPDSGTPFATGMEIGPCPWKPEHQLLRVTLKGREIPNEKRSAANLVFLIDVSGSMNSEDKLPLLQESMRLLIQQLTENDTVSIVTYAGEARLLLPPTNGLEKKKLLAAIESLVASGGTNGEGGIQLAYDTAAKVRQRFDGAVNTRILLATDGDFNIGVTNREQLVQMIRQKAESQMFLTVLGYGRSHLRDSFIEAISNKANGQYAYIDSLQEGRKVFREQLSGTLETIAKDVKIQIEFNPAKVASYRLIGYENRRLANADFADDRKDAGEIGAGHSVTALYELVPAGLPDDLPLKYQEKPVPAAAKGAHDAEFLTLKLRYKEPQGETSRLLEVPFSGPVAPLERTSADFRFAAAVAQYGMLLSGSEHLGKATWANTLELAQSGEGKDANGYRSDFIGLLLKARSLSGRE